MLSLSITVKKMHLFLWKREKEICKELLPHLPRSVAGAQVLVPSPTAFQGTVGGSWFGSRAAAIPTSVLL